MKDDESSPRAAGARRKWRRGLQIALVVVLALWLLNQGLVSRTGNPIEALREKLGAFGYDPKTATFASGEFSHALLGRTAEVRFVVPERPEGVLRVEGVQRLAIGGWTVRGLQVEPIAPSAGGTE